MWISVKDELKPCVDEDGYSKQYPVKIKGSDGWSIGFYIEYGEVKKWIASTWHGDYEITDWYDLPEPPEEE